MKRAIRVLLGLLVAIVGLSLMSAVAFHAIEARVISLFDACRRLMASGSPMQGASRIAMPRASASEPI